MLLSDIDYRNKQMEVLLMQTSSTKLNMFIEDKVKRIFQATRENTLEITSKEELKQVKEIIGILPPIGSKWFIKVDLDKIRDNELFNTINKSYTCFFLITTNRYSNFKLASEKLENKENFYSYYCSYLKRRDLVYLYDALTKENNKLTKTLFDYLASGYSNDVEAIIDLFMAMNKGYKVKTRKNIADVCGIGNNSVETFIFQLLSNLSGTPRGLQIVMKNRIKAGKELAETLGYSTFYNFLKSSVDNCVDIKLLIINGYIYKEIREVPNGYDEKKLGKYQRYLYKIREIPFSKLVRLRKLLNKKWTNEYDFLEFIYTYYNQEYNLIGEKMKG